MSAHMPGAQVSRLADELYEGADGPGRDYLVFRKYEAVILSARSKSS